MREFLSRVVLTGLGIVFAAALLVGFAALIVYNLGLLHLSGGGSP